MISHQYISWSLKKSCSKKEWQKISSWLSLCIFSLNELNDSIKNAPNNNKLLPNWMWKLHRNSFYRLNCPPINDNPELSYINNIEFKLSPTPNLNVSSSNLEKLTILVPNFPHIKTVSISSSLHVYAWIGVLLLLEERGNSNFQIKETSFSKKDLSNILIWAKNSIKNKKF